MLSVIRRSNYHPRKRTGRELNARTISRNMTLAFGWTAGNVFGWGATGHELVSGIAIEKLPDDIPTFARRPTRS
jgi:hypothetical protein